MSHRLVPLMRDVLRYELRRLAGQPRRPTGPAANATQPAGELEDIADCAPAAEVDWARAVLDHAESVLSRDPAPAAKPVAGVPFEELDIGALPDVIAHVVRAHAPVAESDLVQLLRSELALGSLPSNYERLLGRLVWSAKGRRLIELRERLWVAGQDRDGTIPELAGRTLESLAELAAELSDADIGDDALFRAVLADLVGEGERAPRIVATVVGAAIALAHRRGYIDHDRWGQASLDLGTEH